MFNIGFDPILDAEQRHKELIKELEQYSHAKMSEDCTKRKARSSSKLLAMFGKGMASIGINLAMRYGDKAETPAGLSAQDFIGDCQ